MLSCIRISVLWCCVVILLTACGGGGGGGGRVPPTMENPMVSQAREDIADIALAADTLHVTDLFIPASSRLLAGSRAQTTCRGAVCSASLSGATATVSAAEFGDLTGARITVEAEVHGIRNGSVVGRTTAAGITADYTVYGGWLDESFFGYAREDYSGSSGGQSLNGVRAIYAFSLGSTSGSNPMTGSATWTGLMVGAHRDRPTQTIQGRTEAVYSFADQTIDIDMTQLTRGYADMSWEILGVRQGRFEAGADGNSISGSFYGDDHAELGGSFERHGIMGAFGAARQ